ncbi:MAG TPA: hypothetical protein VNI01_09325, partial [Elusimicrobiota bacterium]|nr:hypothetical protein [Elusimicrobiota bacterium]
AVAQLLVGADERTLRLARSRLLEESAQEREFWAATRLYQAAQKVHEENPALRAEGPLPLFAYQGSRYRGFIWQSALRAAALAPWLFWATAPLMIFFVALKTLELTFGPLLMHALRVLGFRVRSLISGQG